MFGRAVELRRDHPLFLAGQTHRKLYYVVRGCIRIYQNIEDQDVNIRFGYQGNFIAALDSFLIGRPTELNAVALRNSRLLTIPYTTIENFIRSSQQNSIWWEETLKKLVVDQMERETDLLTPSHEERYLRVLKRSPQLFQEVPDKYIANYLRMTPETLSRIRRNISKT